MYYGNIFATEFEVCVVCGLSEDDDDGEEIWVECVRCLNWTHLKCLPKEYPFHYNDQLRFCVSNVLKKKKASLVTFISVCFYF